MESQLTLWVAFIAGLVSFLSPCVFPLVPAYVGYMGGSMTSRLAIATPGGPAATAAVGLRFVTFTHSLFFVAGFSLVFVGIGLLSTAFISAIGGTSIGAVTGLIGRIGGLVIIFFGLHFGGLLEGHLTRLRDARSGQSLVFSLLLTLVGAALILWGFAGDVLIHQSPLWERAAWAPLTGVLALAFWLTWLLRAGAFADPTRFWRVMVDSLNSALYADTRRKLRVSNQGFGSSALMGVVFSAGWTPCIGPVYGAVLTLAANGGDVGQAGLLLGAYSLGLGVPFMLTALLLDRAQLFLRRLQHHLATIRLLSGLFLILIGLLVASGALQRLSATLSTGSFAEFAIDLEEQVLERMLGADESATPPPAASSASNGPGSILGLARAGGPAAGTAPGQLAPDFATVDDSGTPLRLADWRGKILLLNFWATWCGPCRIEMPEFERLTQRYGDTGFAVLAINNAESPAAVRAFRAEMSLTFPLGMDGDGTLQELYGVFSYPGTWFIGRDGSVLSRHFGALTVDQLQDLVAEALRA